MRDGNSDPASDEESSVAGSEPLRVSVLTVQVPRARSWPDDASVALYRWARWSLCRAHSRLRWKSWWLRWPGHSRL